MQSGQDPRSKLERTPSAGAASALRGRQGGVERLAGTHDRVHLLRVGEIVATDVGGLALDVRHFSDNGLLVLGENFRQRREALLQEFVRSEEHTSELQSLMRSSYAVFCLKK